jgi:hypothetical protein
MPRLTKLDDVLFPVEEHPIFVSIKDKISDRRLPVPGKKAIVNATNNRVLGIASRAYRLVSNREALEMAQECCRTVFPETKEVEWEARTVDAPGTAGYCCIDLAHNSTVLDFSVVPPDQRPDVFGPFIRVTNSYNALRALSFDIGFFRKVCKNGMIVPETIIKFKFTHLRRDIGEKIKFTIAQDKLLKFRTAFSESMTSLRDCKVPRPQIDPLIRGVLAIRPPQRMEQESREAEAWQALGLHLGEITDRYASELGENAYAAFNTITEFASHPPENRCLHRDRHSLQRLAGTWLSNFAPRCRRNDFKLDDYLKELANSQSEPIAHS